MTAKTDNEKGRIRKTPIRNEDKKVALQRSAGNTDRTPRRRRPNAKEKRNGGKGKTKTNGGATGAEAAKTNATSQERRR